MQRQKRIHTFYNSAFTVVELVVIIAVLAILTTLGTMAFNGVREDAKDDAREANVTVIADQLEAYYAKNGEYPTCDDLTANPATIATNTLPGIDISVFKAPDAPTGTLNSIVCGEAPSTQDVFAYVKEEGVIGFRLRYISESENTIKEIKSRHSYEAIAYEPPEDPQPEPEPEPTGPLDTDFYHHPFTVNEIITICSSTSNAPAGYNRIITTSGDVTGTNGNDIIYAQTSWTSIDEVRGMDGNDILCLRNVDLAEGGNGHDILYVQGNSDDMYGNAGDDVMIGLVSVQDISFLNGGDNNDTFYIVNHVDQVIGGAGYDRLHVTNGSYSDDTGVEERF